MARTCTICGHPKRAELEIQLLKTNTYSTAKTYSVHHDALRRHRLHCMQLAPLGAPTGELPGEVQHAQTVLEELARLTERTERILAKAETEGNAKVALEAIRTAQANLELQAKLQGLLVLKAKQSSLHLHISNEAAQRVAQVYLQRHQGEQLPEVLDGEVEE